MVSEKTDPKFHDPEMVGSARVETTFSPEENDTITPWTGSYESEEPLKGVAAKGFHYFVPGETV